ncbi:MAG: single-stranded DNA-binding protein [Leptospiraceae bacterium]|nr:single-stranded DNA-binding protein [Leptospiraceae bacterium]
MYQSPLNIQQFTGRLVRDPEIKQTPTGKMILSFSLAYATRHSSDREGSFTSYINVEAWEKLANHFATRLEKGMQILVKGSLVQNRWVSDGQKKSVFKLVAQAISITDLKRRPAESTESAENLDQVA